MNLPRLHTIALTGAITAGIAASALITWAAGIGAYYGGAIALGIVALIGLADYAWQPLPGPEDPIDRLGDCTLDCPVRTWCEDCDKPLCGAHAATEDRDPHACHGNSMDGRCHDCVPAHLDDCHACAAAVAGRW